ncbi:hypothetical protein [Streptomyces sp. NPDC060002]|uniref:hypothetical protein n=1 Tax=Streptomyces sp. NPDC060002 TaxID=3347033 RepID=UPI0036988F95
MQGNDEDGHPEYLSTGWSAPPETRGLRRTPDDQATAVTVWRTGVYPVRTPPSPAEAETEVLPPVQEEPHRSQTTMIWRGEPVSPASSRRSRHRASKRPGRVPRGTVPVLLAVALAAALMVWHPRSSAELAVTGVAMTASPADLGCDDTAEVMAVVSTNGAAGTLRYRWLRSDGTDSGELRERVRAGQGEVKLPMLWHFHGTGTHQAQAVIDLLGARPRSAATAFTYRCRR